MRKFLDTNGYAALSETWRESKLKNEHPDAARHYMMQRIEGSSDMNTDIGYLHNIPFIRGIIPEKISALGGERKVRILDIGTGAAFFPDQIREQFGDAVEVYSTGIDKKIATSKRGTPLHKNDVKWHSISELSDHPEFDLIVDTIGEVEYRSQYRKEYFEHVINKLESGGDAYLVLLYDTAAYASILEICDELNNNQCEITCKAEDQLIRIHIHKL